MILNIFNLDYDGLFLSNGPGDPTKCFAIIENLRKWINNSVIKPVNQNLIQSLKYFYHFLINFKIIDFWYLLRSSDIIFGGWFQDIKNEVWKQRSQPAMYFI
jgi:hypothetical protein